MSALLERFAALSLDRQLLLLSISATLDLAEGGAARRHKLRPCGTRAAYRRHQRAGEDPCSDCRAANSRDRARRRAQGRAAAASAAGAASSGQDGVGQ